LKVQKAGAIFNPEKLRWYNKEYVKRLPAETVIAELKKRLSGKDEAMMKKIVEIVRERISVWSDIEPMIAAGEIEYFFTAPSINPDMLVWKKGGTKAEAKENLGLVLEILKTASDFSPEALKGKLMPLAEQKGKGNVLWPLRVSLSGREQSPDPFTLLAIFGAVESQKRITAAIHALS